jgi:UDP-glucose 4-epimerase
MAEVRFRERFSMTKGKIVITGVAGFLGSHLLPSLLQMGHTVSGIDNLSFGSRRNLESFLNNPRFAFIEADILAPGVLHQACADAQVIVHLASEKIPRYSSSLRTLDVNVKGTEAVLDAAKDSGARVIFASTDEVYGKNQDLPLVEESMLVYGTSHSNRWSLAVSKMFGEHLCFAYQEKYGVPITIVRYSGGYGPTYAESWSNSPVNIFVEASLEGTSLPIHGDGTQTRSFTYIDDLVDGTMLVLDSSAVDGEIVNLGSDNQISIINLAYLAWRAARAKGKPNLQFVPYTDFSNLYEDVQHRVVDYSKARYLLGYAPKVTMEEGVRKLIQWYQQREKKSSHSRKKRKSNHPKT